MAPRVRDGAICLFGPAGGGRLQGRILLVEHRALDDPDLGGPYALKRVKSVRARIDGATRVTLESLNRRYKPIVLALDDPAELRVIGELVDVLV